MSPGAPPFAPPGAFEAGRQRLGMSLHQLWVGYFAVGGNAPLAQVDEWLSGASSPSPSDHDLLAQALNDVFVERGLNHPIPYSDR